MRLIDINEFEKLREVDFKNLVVVNDEDANKNYCILVDDKEKSLLKGTDFIDFLRKEKCLLNDRINVRYYYLQEHKDEE